eukprot:g7418.t1
MAPVAEGLASNWGQCVALKFREAFRLNEKRAAHSLEPSDQETLASVAGLGEGLGDLCTAENVGRRHRNEGDTCALGESAAEKLAAPAHGLDFVAIFGDKSAAICLENERQGHTWRISSAPVCSEEAKPMPRTGCAVSRVALHPSAPSKACHTMAKLRAAAAGACFGWAAQCDTQPPIWFAVRTALDILRKSFAGASDKRLGGGLSAVS